MQLRAPFETKQTKIANGTMFEVDKLTDSTLTLTTDKDKAVKFDTSQPYALDYGYAVTSYGSQGKTIDRVLIHAETGESKQLLNERMAYVAVSRARDEALIFTDDAEKLSDKMARQLEKTEIPQSRPEKQMTNDILSRIRESLDSQSVEVSKEAWTNFEKDLTDNFSQQKPTENQLSLIERWQSEHSKTQHNLEEMTRLEAVQKLLDVADDRQRNEIAKNTMERYEQQAKEMTQRKEMEKTNYDHNRSFSR